MKQLVVASEYGEPSRYEDIICQRLSKKKDICLLLITKNLPGCGKILTVADGLSIPYQIHCTITGLGGTAFEPQILAPNLMVESCLEFFSKHMIDLRTVTLRIDPIINEALGLQLAEAIEGMQAFSKAGVKDCRISVVDYYPHVRERFDNLGIGHPNSFQLQQDRKDELINYFLQQANRFNMNLHLCAEQMPAKPNYPNIDTEGCASAASWERLGITGLKPPFRKQRRECTCDLGKQDLLTGLSKGCPDGCAYCYWRTDG